MRNMYTKEVNAQIIVSLLKAHGISKFVVSPGTTNVALIGTIQNDSFFTVYSSVDERSAAYLACGLSEESGEPVVLSCTGATASRNYVSGLTEAYYRKLPILAITSMQNFSKVGHHVPQVIDRSVIQNDISKLSVELPIVKDTEDQWDCEVKVNKAILELKRHGGGPVHINLPTTYTLPFEKGELPSYRKIERVIASDPFPKICGKVAVFVGAHKKWSLSQTEALDNFCATNNAVVFCDHTSNYKGKYKVLFSLAAAQEMMDISKYQPDIMIHIGEISGDYASFNVVGKEVWRVNVDGELRDTFGRLKYIFEMQEEYFFKMYSQEGEQDNTYYQSCMKCLKDLRGKIPDLPFSNIWIASILSKKLPKDSILHLAILNSLRSWNYFEIDNSINSTSNVGGFGIDGVLSTVAGASLNDSGKIYYCVIGDLAFFYDINVVGNKHLGDNLRILVVNNGKGTEFRQYNHHASYFGKDADSFIAASEHFGNKSQVLIKSFVENLGFDYISASNKDEFNAVYDVFVSSERNEKPLVFEVFTDSHNESTALQMLNNLEKEKKLLIRNKAKNMVGASVVKIIKQLF